MRTMSHWTLALSWGFANLFVVAAGGLGAEPAQEPLPLGAIARYGRLDHSALLVTRIAVAEDGKTLTTLASPPFRRTWSLDDGRLLRTDPMPVQHVRGVSADLSQGVIVEGEWRPTSLNVVDLANGKVLDRWKPLPPMCGAHHFEFSADKNRLMAAGRMPQGDEQLPKEGNYVAVRDRRLGTVSMLRGPRGQINSIALSPDGRRAYALFWDNADGAIVAWDVDSAQTLWTTRHRGGMFGRLIASADGKSLVHLGFYAQDGHYVRRVDSATGKETGKEMRIADGTTDNSAVNATATRLVCRNDHAVRLIDLEAGREVASLGDRRGHLAFTPDGSQFVLVNETVRCFHSADGRSVRPDRPEQTADGHRSWVGHDAAMRPDGMQAVTVDAQGLVVWNTERRRVQYRVPKLRGPFASSADGKVLFAVGHVNYGSAAVYAVDWETGSARTLIAVPRDDSCDATVQTMERTGPDRLTLTTTEAEDAVGTGSYEVTIQLGREVRSERRELPTGGPVISSTDGTAQFQSANAGVVRANGKSITLERGAGERIIGGAFSSDGKRLIGGLVDTRIRQGQAPGRTMVPTIWSIADGKIVRRLPAIDAAPVMFRADDKTIVADYSARLLFLDAESGKELSEIRKGDHTDGPWIQWISTAKGRSLISIHRFGTMLEWPIPAP